MMMLHDFQKSFKEAALSNDVSKLDEFFCSRVKKDQQKRFSIYRNTIFLSLIETLSHSFPTVSKLVGDDNFKILSREFVKIHLPDKAHLSAYGSSFSEFIATQEQVTSDIPYLAELAWLDWQRHLSYFSSDYEVLDMSVLSSIKPEDVFSAKLTLASSVFLFKSSFPIAHLLKMEKLEIETLSFEEEFLLTQRIQGSETIQSRRIAEAEFMFLTQLQAGNELGEAYILTTEKFPSFDLQEALTQSFHNKLISHVCV